MRSVYVLCTVVLLGLITHVVFALCLPLHTPLSPFGGYTAAHAFFVWWLYVAPLFIVAAAAVLIWKSWMEAMSRNAKIGGWIAVIVAAAINLSMAFEMLTGRI